MKLKMFKKIVSLASAFTIVATCLAGLNFSVSAAGDDEVSQVPAIYEDAEFVVNAGTTLTIKPNSTSDGIDGLTVGGRLVKFYEEANPTVEEEAVEDEEGNVIKSAALPDTKWVIESATPGTASSNAFFRNEKDTSNKKNSGYSLKTVASSDLSKYGMSSMWEQTLGGFKAAGQFNNIVDVRLVSKNYTPKKGSPVEEDDEDVYSNGGYSYDLKAGQKVYLAFRLYINPSDVNGPVCTATKATNTPAKGIVFTPPVYNTNATVKTNAALKLDEGKSFKLPFKASAGDSGLTWTSDKPECFTVVNGTVKAIGAGNGHIIIKSINNPSYSATVDVEVTPVVTAVRSNVTTLDLITKVKSSKLTDGDVQYITVSPKTSTNATINYTLSLLKDSKGISFVDASGKSALSKTVKSVGGVLTFGVKTTSTFELKKGEKIVITPVCNDKSLAGAKTIKPINITVKTTTYPDYVKNFKETVKADKVTGYREVNVMVGGKAALNLSINPVTALNGFEWAECDENGAPATSNTAKISNNGDVVEGVTPGTCYYKAKSVGKDKDGEPVESSIYKINVYKPASSFEFKDNTSTGMVVKGGYLMESDNASKACDKKIIGGKRYTFTEPSCGTNSEPIVWTSNKPEAVVFAENGIMNLTVLANASATYTITGTSQYTKQKYSFKVMAKESDEELDETSNDKFVGIDKELLELVKGEKYQLIPDVAGTFDSAKNAKITYAADFSDDADKKSKAVSVNGSGVITANKATIGTVTVTATIPNGEEVTVVVTVKENTADPVLTASTTSINGAKPNSVKLTLKNAPKNGEVKYYINGVETTLNKGALNIPAYVSETVISSVVTDKDNNPVVKEDGNNETVTKKVMIAVTEDDNSDKKYTFDNTTVIPNPTKEYKIEAKVDDEVIGEVIVTAYNGFMTKQPKIVDYEAKDDVSNPVELKALKSAKEGVKAGSTFKLPIALESKITTGTGKNKVVKNYYNDLSVVDDEIMWTSSNDYIITAIKPVGNDRIGTVELPEGGKIGDTVSGTYYGKYYQEYEFTTSSEYTGKVTLTGVTKNGGKKITLTLYVVK